MNCDQYEQRDVLDHQLDLLKKKIRIKTRQIEKVKKYQKNQRVFDLFINLVLILIFLKENKSKQRNK